MKGQTKFGLKDGGRWTRERDKKNDPGSPSFLNILATRASLSVPIMSSLQGYVDRRVLLVLQDGRAIVGTLAGFDQKSNIVLADSKERVYSVDEGVEEIPLGLYLVKGEMICLVGEIDEEIDKSVDLDSIRAEPLPPIRYG
jgi:U6 snRNA-associated Sm-like protein LSm8